MFDNHDSPLTQKLSRHLRVYVYGYSSISGLSFSSLSLALFIATPFHGSQAGGSGTTVTRVALTLGFDSAPLTVLDYGALWRLITFVLFY
mgnify:CR=1 FL=1